MSSTTLQQIRDLLDVLTPEEQLHLIEVIAQRLRRKEAVPREEVRLRGFLKGQFPPDFDLDGVLGEIRSESARALEEPPS